MIHVTTSFQDLAYAIKLRRQLIQRGHEVHLSDYYGKDLTKIHQQLHRAAVIIVLMSEPAYESIWVLGELELALRQQKVIFPLSIDGTMFPRLTQYDPESISAWRLPSLRFFQRLEQWVQPAL